MKLSLLLLCLPLFLAAPTQAQPTTIDASPQQDDDKIAEYETKRKAAGKDVEKLWDLYLWCDAYGMDKQGRSCLRAILKVDDAHEEAHKALGHLEFDGKWFTTQKKLDQYKKAEELRIAEEQGLVRFGDEWVPKEDLAYLERGMIRDDDGAWVSKEDYEKQKAGWSKQDTVWVSPDEKENIDKGLWKCGEEWKTLDDANAYHAEIGRWWIIPSEYFLLYTTLDRKTALEAVEIMERTYRDLNRALGKSPAAPVIVTMLRNQTQYGRFAAGGDGNPQTEVRGLSSVHYAFLADSWFSSELEYLGCGAGYWDVEDENGAAWGRHSARHAAALSLIESADPSPKAIEKGKKSRLQSWRGDDYWSEKAFPEWFRFGLSSYADRYFIDQFVERGGNYNWARDWSVQNLLAKGGVRPLPQLFTTELSVERLDDSAKLLNELGLILAFALDGKNPEVAAAYGAVKNAIREGDRKQMDKAFKDLEKAIIANEKALLEFAGI